MMEFHIRIMALNLLGIPADRFRAVVGPEPDQAFIAPVAGIFRQFGDQLVLVDLRSVFRLFPGTDRPDPVALRLGTDGFFDDEHFGSADCRSRRGHHPAVSGSDDENLRLDGLLDLRFLNLRRGSQPVDVVRCADGRNLVLHGHVAALDDLPVAGLEDAVRDRLLHRLACLRRAGNAVDGAALRFHDLLFQLGRRDAADAGRLGRGVHHDLKDAFFIKGNLHGHLSVKPHGTRRIGAGRIDCFPFRSGLHARQACQRAHRAKAQRAFDKASAIQFFHNFPSFPL